MLDQSLSAVKQRIGMANQLPAVILRYFEVGE